MAKTKAKTATKKRNYASSKRNQAKFLKALMEYRASKEGEALDAEE